MVTKAKPRNIAPASYERIQVKCYSGYKGNERPMAFTHQGRRREVEEVVDRWYEGGVDPGRLATDYLKLSAASCGESSILKEQYRSSFARLPRSKLGDALATEFKVKTADGEIFIPRYLSLFDAWSIRV